ncbi:hypothetical protein T4C_10475 [Trichinella pseudospiralis]|uniref:Uncharacterized protein n=1 Tax=Trichinella pseudospiralis TaxID=6337 RepID=A0A0V1I929_TRIPS|nr:hypothetical protein T4C_5740 [Trichinella pseudospiralis]KRZ18964.1 hypothetical protein T4C_10475 [Trichinella pseudospiralis]
MVLQDSTVIIECQEAGQSRGKFAFAEQSCHLVRRLRLRRIGVTDPSRVDRVS